MTASIKIGHSDVVSGPLGLGTNKIGGHNLFPGLDDQTGVQTVKAALDHGISMLDTAFMYGLGNSEYLIGQAIADYDRHQIVIATKAAQDPDQELRPNNRPAFLTQQVDNALQRLGTDYIDIFYIHFPDQDTPKYEAVGALEKLKEAGKIRAIGVSNFSLDQLKEANQDGYVDIVEDAYNLIDRQAAQTLMPYLQQQKISFVPYFPLASGLLTGKYQANQTFEPGSWQAKRANFQGERFAAITTALAETIKPIAAAHQATPAQVVLAWYIQDPAIAVVIPGARTPEQAAQNAAALNVTLSVDEVKQISAAFKHLPA